MPVVRGPTLPPPLVPSVLAVLLAVPLAANALLEEVTAYFMRVFPPVFPAIPRISGFASTAPRSSARAVECAADGDVPLEPEMDVGGLRHGPFAGSDPLAEQASLARQKPTVTVNLHGVSLR